MASIEKIEERINYAVAGSSEIQMGFGGVQFKTMMELMEFSKLMAVSGVAVPVHLRGNPGACLAIATRAMRFGFDPFSLAEHSFPTVKRQKNENTGNWEAVETMAYDSFVIHAIIEAHAPITGRMRITYEGEGDSRVCIVTAIPKGEKEPLSIRSQPLGEIIAKKQRNDKGQIKGSPLWEIKPDQQLAYDTRRDFCRRYFPEILMGWYDKDEYEEYSRAQAAIDVTPESSGLKERLAGQKGRKGFHAKNTEALPPPSENDKPLNIVIPEVKEAAPVEVEKTAPQDEQKSAGTEPEEAVKETLTTATETEATPEEAEDDLEEPGIDELRHEYLPLKIEALGGADTVKALEEINAEVRTVLAKNDRNDLLGEWNSAYLDRKRTVSTFKSNKPNKAPALAPASQF